MHSADDIIRFVNGLKSGERMRLEDVPFATYLNSPGIGSTLLKAAARTMEHYHLQKLGINPITTTLQHTFDIGTAVHTLVLEPDKFEDQVVCAPLELKRVGTKAWKEWAEEHEGKILLKTDDYDNVLCMAERVMGKAGQFFTDGKAEVSYWYRCPKTDLILKARADYEIGDGIIDLKTANKNTPQEFEKRVLYEYAIQDSLYRMVSDTKDMIFIGVEKTMPFSVFGAKQGEEVRMGADIIVKETLDKIRFAEEMNTFEGYKFELLETGYGSRNF